MMSYREIFRAEQLPVFQNKMFKTQAEAKACTRGDVVLVQDMDTGLVFNSAFDPESLVYDSDYQNEQACSSVFQNHLNDVLNIINRHLSGKSLIEVGCGKGYFMNYLKREGYNIRGIDPAYEGDNSDVIKNYFEPGLGITAEGVILRHVLEHVLDPVRFLKNIAEANEETGVIYIEVPCFDWICNNQAWFDIFYEHVNYFRLSDFHRMFETVYECGHVFGGQYLYVVADLASIRSPVCLDADTIDFPKNFLSGIQQISAKSMNKQITVWGGASKGVIFSLYMQRQGVQINQLIDINPSKQGKFVAGTGLKVTAPGEALTKMLPGEDIYVMNSNYIEEIRTVTRNQYNYIKVES